MHLTTRAQLYTPFVTSLPVYYESRTVNRSKSGMKNTEKYSFSKLAAAGARCNTSSVGGRSC